MTILRRDTVRAGEQGGGGEDRREERPEEWRSGRRGEERRGEERRGD